MCASFPYVVGHILFKGLGKQGSSSPHPATLAFDHHCGASLRELQLQGLQFDVLDLAKAPCLSTIRLESDITCGEVLCKLSLPSCLEHFQFAGSYLFTEQGRSALCDCSLLTKLDLSPYFFLSDCPEYMMPVLPSSLAHLIISIAGIGVEDGRGDTFVGSLSLLYLQACTNLERLTLPSRYCQSDQELLAKQNDHTFPRPAHFCCSRHIL